MSEQNELGWQKVDLYVSRQAQELAPELKERLEECFKPVQPPTAPELEEENSLAPQGWDFPEAILVYQDPLCQEEQRIPVSVSAGANKEDGGKESQRVVLSLRLGAIREGKQTILSKESKDWVVPLDVLARMTYGLDCLASGGGEKVPENLKGAGFSVEWNRQDSQGKTFRTPEIERLTIGFGQTPESFAQALADSSNHCLRLESGTPTVPR